MIRRRLRRPSLLRMFAVRSAVVFAVVGVSLHFVISDLVEAHFMESAEFHAVFVTDAVMTPLLGEFPLDEGELTPQQRAAVAEALTRFALDGDVTRVTAWRPDGTVVAATTRR